MGRLDVNGLRYLSKDELRTLQAVEQGMKNHDIVPVELIASIASLKHGGVFKCLQNLLRLKLLRHDRKRYDGYSLNFLGYDYLSFSALSKRNSIRGIGRQIGVGKESDVYLALDGAEDKQVVVKMHRLGRTSFRKIKEKRDYHQHRKFANWLYLSRLAAQKEIAFMRCLRDAGFAVPEPVDQNRHCVVMSLVDGYPLTQIREIMNPGKVFAKLMEMQIKLAQCGLVHCDFNEFNVLINENEELTFIDFPQMVSVSHANAPYYFNRDIECLRLFFERRYGFRANSVPTLADCGVRIMELDKIVAASGFSKQEQEVFDEAMETYRQNVGNDEGEGEESDEDDDDNEDGEMGETEVGEQSVGHNDETATGQATADQDESESKAVNLTVAGEEFRVLEVTQADDGMGEEEDAQGDGAGEGDENGADGSSNEEGSVSGGEEDAVLNEEGEKMEPSHYDRSDDVRRAWRFTGRPGGSKGGAADKAKKGKGEQQPGQGWKKRATNKVKDRDRAKIRANIKDCM